MVAEPAKRPRETRREGAAHERLHALSAIWQSEEGCALAVGRFPFAVG